MLWKGFVVPAFPELPVFSCPALPLRNPIISSPSSSFFFRPQILHATIASPPSTIAPPIPTTTPITVALVFGDIFEDDELFEEREAAVAVEEGVEVVEPTDVVGEPSTVMTVVKTTTLGVAVVVSELSLVDVVFSSTLEDVGAVDVSFACVAELVSTAGVDVETGVVESTVLCGVLETTTGVDDEATDATVAVDEGTAALAESGVDEADWAALLVDTASLTAFLICRRKRSASYQLACASARHRARTDSSRN